MDDIAAERRQPGQTHQQAYARFLETPDGMTLYRASKVARFAVRRCILAHVGPARVDAQAFDVARRAVRHVTPPPHQNRSACRRDKDDDSGSLSDIVSRTRYCALLHSGESRASSPERRGVSPQKANPPVNPKTSPAPHSGHRRRRRVTSTNLPNQKLIVEVTF
jgi:hypothetical protein